MVHGIKKRWFSELSADDKMKRAAISTVFEKDKLLRYFCLTLKPMKQCLRRNTHPKVPIFFFRCLHFQEDITVPWGYRDALTTCKEGRLRWLRNSKETRRSEHPKRKKLIHSRTNRKQIDYTEDFSPPMAVIVFTSEAWISVPRAAGSSEGLHIMAL